MFTAARCALKGQKRQNTSVSYPCFCPCRAHFIASTHPGRCPGLCACWAFSPHLERLLPFRLGTVLFLLAKLEYTMPCGPLPLLPGGSPQTVSPLHALSTLRFLVPRAALSQACRRSRSTCRFLHAALQNPPENAGNSKKSGEKFGAYEKSRTFALAKRKKPK